MSLTREPNSRITKRHEELLDVAVTLSLGHQSKMRWNDRSEWIWSEAPTREAIRHHQLQRAPTTAPPPRPRRTEPDQQPRRLPTWVTVLGLISAGLFLVSTLAVTTSADPVAFFGFIGFITWMIWILGVSAHMWRTADATDTQLGRPPLTTQMIPRARSARSARPGTR